MAFFQPLGIVPFLTVMSSSRVSYGTMASPPIFSISPGMQSGPTDMHSSSSPIVLHALPISSFLTYSNYTWGGVQVMKLLIMQFSRTSCHFIPLWSKYSPNRCIMTKISLRIGGVRDSKATSLEYKPTALPRHQPAW
jgi:hypothetical protein